MQQITTAVKSFALPTCHVYLSHTYVHIVILEGLLRKGWPGMRGVVISHIIILFFVTVEAKDQISELTDEISRKAEDNIRQQVRTCTTTTLWEIICEWLSMLNQFPLVYFSTGRNHAFDQHCGGFTK